MVHPYTGKGDKMFGFFKREQKKVDLIIKVHELVVPVSFNGYEVTAYEQKSVSYYGNVALNERALDAVRKLRKTDDKYCLAVLVSDTDYTVAIAVSDGHGYENVVCVNASTSHEWPDLKIKSAVDKVLPPM